jgi:hypothetical protein
MSAKREAKRLLERSAQVMADYGVADDDVVRSHLAQEIALMRQRRNPLAYEGPQGFVLSHGLDWRSPPELPEPFDWMERKNCFGNATTLALQDPRLTYCEGYAMGRFLPIPHAWVVDRRGVVIDPTWWDEDDTDDMAPRQDWQYVGVPFTRRWLVEQITQNRTYGLLAQLQTDYRMLQRPLPHRAVPARYRDRAFAHRAG